MDSNIKTKVTIKLNCPITGDRNIYSCPDWSDGLIKTVSQYGPLYLFPWDESMCWEEVSSILVSRHVTSSFDPIPSTQIRDLMRSIYQIDHNMDAEYYRDYDYEIYISYRDYRFNRTSYYNEYDEDEVYDQLEVYKKIRYY